MRLEQSIPVPENVGIQERIPGSLSYALSNLWRRHFGENSGFYDGTWTGVDYMEYQYKAAQVALALEHLNRTGVANLDPALLGANGRIHPNLPDEDAQELLFQKKPLNGVELLVIGGPEGRIFAEMGATVVGIDPRINQAPKISLPNLEELAKRFGSWNIPDYQNRFNLTFSCRLFDSGSGLLPFCDLFNNRAYDVYQDTLGALLEVTRPAGIGIHDGNEMFYAISDNIVRCRLVETATLFKYDKPGDRLQMYVVQKN